MNESRHYRFFRQKDFLIGFLLTILLAVCLVSNLLTLFKYEIPLGVDGFYYVVQIENFLKTGNFYYPARTPVVLYLAAGLSSFGIEPAAAVKILSSILYTILILLVYLIINRSVNDKWFALFGVLVVEISALRISWIVEFVNNLGGVTFLLCGIYCLGKRTENKFWTAAGVFSGTLGVFCHKSVFPLILLLAAGYGMFYLLYKSFGTRIFPWFLGFTILTGFFYPVIFAAAPFNDFFPFLSGNVSENPKFPLLIKGFFEEKFILTILSPTAFFISLWKSEVNKNIALANGAISTLSLFVTLNPFLNYTTEIVTIPDRLALLMHLQIAFLSVFTARLVGFDKTSKIIAATAMLVILLSGNIDSTKGINEKYLAQRQNLVKGLENFQKPIPPPSVVIAPHGFQFLITSALKVRSQRLMPNDNSRIFWLVFGVPCDKVEKTTIVSVEGKTCTSIIGNGDAQPISIQDKRKLLNSNPHLERADKEIKDNLLPTEELQ